MQERCKPSDIHRRPHNTYRDDVIGKSHKLQDIALVHGVISINILQSTVDSGQPTPLLQERNGGTLPLPGIHNSPAMKKNIYYRWILDLCKFIKKLRPLLHHFWYSPRWYKHIHIIVSWRSHAWKIVRVLACTGQEKKHTESNGEYILTVLHWNIC